MPPEKVCLFLRTFDLLLRQNPPALCDVRGLPIPDVPTFQEEPARPAFRFVREMRDPRLAAPGSDDLRHRRTLSDERNYAGTPPLIGTSASAFESYRTTMAQREAAARSARPGAPAHSAAAAAALLDGVRPHHWTSEHERMQRTFAQLRAQRHDLAQLPYPTPPPAAPVAQVPPPQPQPQPTAVPIHRVYIVRCATCDTFLSDRGMRVSLGVKHRAGGPNRTLSRIPRGDVA